MNKYEIHTELRCRNFRKATGDEMGQYLPFLMPLDSNVSWC